MDKVIRGLLCGNTVNLTAITGRELVEAARAAHGLSRVCTAALGRTLLMTAMMSVHQKTDGERVTAIVKGGGPTGNIVCTGGPAGVVKGYIEEPCIELPPAPDGKLDVSMAVGWFGELTVVRDMGLKEPYVGTCKLVSGEIAEDFAQYFTVSEQQPSLVYLGVKVDIESGETLAAGGLLLQPLPQCPEEAIDALQAKAGDITHITGRLAEGESLEAVLDSLFGELELTLTDSTAASFCCDCSRGRLEQVLMSVGADELRDMIEKDRGAQLTCRFCNKSYDFSETDLRHILAELSAEK